MHSVSGVDEVVSPLDSVLLEVEGASVVVVVVDVDVDVLVDSGVQLGQLVEVVEGVEWVHHWSGRSVVGSWVHHSLLGVDGVVEVVVLVDVLVDELVDDEVDDDSESSELSVVASPICAHPPSAGQSQTWVSLFQCSPAAQYCFFSSPRIQR